MSQQGKPLKIFYSYSHLDKTYRDELSKSLVVFVRQGIITEWCDLEITAGVEYNKEIAEKLESADIIILLLSRDFIGSDYCMGIETDKALKMHNEHKARIIPIIVRDCTWKDTKLKGLQLLPMNAKPVKDWPNRDKAWVDVVNGIKKVFVELGYDLTMTKYNTSQTAGTQESSSRSSEDNRSSQKGSETLSLAIKSTTTDRYPEIRIMIDFYKITSEMNELKGGADRCSLHNKNEVVLDAIGSAYIPQVERFRDDYKKWIGEIQTALPHVWDKIKNNDLSLSPAIEELASCFYNIMQRATEIKTKMKNVRDQFEVLWEITITHIIIQKYPEVSKP